MVLTTAQKLAASSRIPDGDEALLDRVPITSAGGRYDDGIAEVNATDFEEQEARQARLRKIARDEEFLGRKRSDGSQPTRQPIPLTPVVGFDDINLDGAEEEDGGLVAGLLASDAPAAVVADQPAPAQEDDPTDEEIGRRLCEESVNPEPAVVKSNADLADIEADQTVVPSGRFVGRAIRRIRDGHIFASGQAAADSVGVSASAIRNAIEEKRFCRGEKFEYVESKASAREYVVPPTAFVGRKVRRLKDGHIFKDAAEAAAAYGGSASAFRQAMYKRGQFRGEKFEWIGDLAPSLRKSVQTQNAQRAGTNEAKVVPAPRRPFRRVDAAKPAQIIPEIIPTEAASATAVENFDATEPTEKSVARTTSPGDDTTFLAKTMFAFAKGGGSIQDIDAVVAEARRIAEARRLIAAIDGEGGGLILRDGRLEIADNPARGTP